jgi:predicted RNase H-like HicB family nuclease
MDCIPVPEAARVGRPECEFVRMGPPPGVRDEDCGTAEMLVSPPGRIPGFGGRANYAYFRPTPEELEQLKAGGFIELAQYGSVVQPFGMAVWPAWEGEPTLRHVPEDGGFWIAEDPKRGCSAWGRSRDVALSKLREVQATYDEAASAEDGGDRG